MLQCASVSQTWGSHQMFNTRNNNDLQMIAEEIQELLDSNLLTWDQCQELIHCYNGQESEELARASMSDELRTSYLTALYLYDLNPETSTMH